MSLQTARNVSRQLGLRTVGLMLCLVLVSAFGAAGAGQAAAAASEPPPAILTLDEAALLLRVGSSELRSLAERGDVPGREIEGQWRFERSALLDWLAGRSAPITHELSGEDLAVVVGRGPEGEEEGRQGDGRIGEEPPYRTAEEVFLREHRVLLGKGQVVVEPSVFYSKVDNRVLTVEDLELTASNGQTILVLIHGFDQIEQHTTDAFLTARYGIFDETEVYSGLSFRHRQTLSDKSGSDSFSELRHVKLGARTTILREGRRKPDVVLAVEGQVPLGGNAGSIEGQAWLVKSFDPMVLIAGGRYRRSFVWDTMSVTRIEPENLFDVTLGYAFAVNDELTLSTRLIARFEGKTAFRDFVLEKDQDYNLQLGVTGKAEKGPFIEPTITFGLDGPGTRVMFGLSLPFLFQP